MHALSWSEAFAWVLAAAFAASAVACSSTASHPLGLMVIDGGDCPADLCKPVDAGDTAAAAPPRPPVKADCVFKRRVRVDGQPDESKPVVIRGGVGVMMPPQFKRSRKALDLSPLAHPALVRMPIGKTDYTSPFAPGPGALWELGPMPSLGGKLTIIVTEDVDDKNGIISTLDGAGVTETSMSGGNWMLPVALRADLEAIYGDLPIDPARGQVILSIQESRLFGGDDAAPIAGVSVGASMADAVFVEGENGWETSGQTGKTGASGVAVIANVETDPYPGAEFELVCNREGLDPGLVFRVAQGIVSRPPVHAYGTLGP